MDYDEVAVVDDDAKESGGEERAGRSLAGRHPHHRQNSPMSKTRSLSDGGGTPGRKLSPSPLILEASRRTTKDDSSLSDLVPPLPVTPRRIDFHSRGLSLQMPPRDLSPAAHPTVHAATKPVPLSPKLDHSQIYASPTNILPRRSRGLDFSRAATSLHHSTLAEQSSPDSSPTIGTRGMNIPGRPIGEHAAAETTNSLWSMMSNQERMVISSSLGSVNNICSDSSSNSDDYDMMDEDMDEAYVTTPQVTRVGPPNTQSPGNWAGGGGSGSPAVNSLLSFQQRQRPRKQPKRRVRGPLGLGFSSIGAAASSILSKSPPNNNIPKEAPAAHSRRESISWAANQLHISGSESDDNPKSQMEGSDALGSTPGRDGQRGVVKRVVTRRGNLLPKTKGFARIRAALAEESAPIDSEFRREAEVVRQVRESDMDLESLPTTAYSSPNMPVHDNIDEICDDPMPMDAGLGLSSSFKQQALKNSKGKDFWDTFSESSVTNAPTAATAAAAAAAASRTTPPPPAFPRGSSSGFSLDDMSMDSPFASSTQSSSVVPAGAVFPMTTTSSSGGDTPQPTAGPPLPPTAAEITRRINSKRRRDDDFDPVSFKRRAVSPGMSVHNSPVMQSPLQRDMAPWGSRPGSNGGDRAGGSGAPSEAGSQGPSQGQGTSGNGGGGGGSGGGAGRVNGNKGRVGYQGMVDTHDGITRLSIE